MKPRSLRERMPGKLTKEDEEKHFREMESADVNRKQQRSMITAALLTIIPVVVLMLAAIYGMVWLLFLR